MSDGVYQGQSANGVSSLVGEAVDAKADLRIPADDPIEGRAEDSVGRADLAERFADQVLAQDAGKGIVVGVLGPWGSGKTSFINLARERVAREVPILDFNPWMFSGAAAAVVDFAGASDE